MIIKRFFTPPTTSFFLFGQYSTGKSTLMKNYFSDAFWIDFLDPEVRQAYRAKPGLLAEYLRANPHVTNVVIHALQKVPAFFDMVHTTIEEFRHVQFILISSSSRKLKQVGTNLMTGSLLSSYLHPFMASELGKDFALNKALTLGMLPITIGTDNVQQKIPALIERYFREEIESEGLVRNSDSFSRFLRAISFSHATQLNTTNVARECEVNRKTVENYIAILEALLLAHKLHIFTRRARRELSAHPKLYLFDAGVFNALRPRGPVDRPEEIHGAGLERHRGRGEGRQGPLHLQRRSAGRGPSASRHRPHRPGSRPWHDGVSADSD